MDCCVTYLTDNVKHFNFYLKISEIKLCRGEFCYVKIKVKKRKNLIIKKKGWTCGGDHTKTHNIGFIEKIKKKTF